jgi:putative ABC transport system permease protein
MSATEHSVEVRPGTAQPRPIGRWAAWRRRSATLAFLAARNVVRELRRSLLTSSAMAVGLALLFISRTLADGAHEAWIDSGVRLGAGHVAVQAPGYLTSGALADRLNAGSLATVERALGAPNVAPAITASVERLTVSGLAASAASSYPVQINGVTPTGEQRFDKLPEQVVDGRYLEDDDRLSAFIGVGLARRLELRPGSRFVLTSQNSDGEIAGQLVRVSGTFRTGIPEVDDGLVQIPIETARTWLAAPGSATTVAILLHSSREVDRVVRTLRAQLDDTSSVRVLSWRESSPELEAAVKVDDAGDYIFHGILFVIVGLAVLNAVLMSVLNRRREFGVLRALGLRRIETGAVVFGEGVLLTLASGATGILLGFAISWIFWRNGLDMTGMMGGEMTVSGTLIDPVIVPAFHLSAIVQSLAFILVIGTLASLYPAQQAMRIDVAEAMKFER